MHEQGTRGAAHACIWPGTLNGNSDTQAVVLRLLRSDVVLQESRVEANDGPGLLECAELDGQLLRRHEPPDAFAARRRGE